MAIIMDTRRDYPRPSSIPKVFAQVVQRNGASMALSFPGASLTYAELDARADELAGRLEACGLRPGDVVALSLERSAELVVAILAILKAGGAYLPLDPDNPQARNRRILQDATPSLAIEQSQGSLARLVGAVSVPTLALDSAASAPPHGNCAITETAKADGSELAYVMYTSGSTGGPKGVCVPHRAVLRLVCNTDYIEILPAHRIAQASNMAFDAATFEMWGALLNGACLVGVPRDILLSPKDLKVWLQRERIDVIFLTTALLNRIAAEEPEAFASVDTVLFGGEAVTPKWVREILANAPPRRLLHVYGPTECTTFATWHRVRSVDPDAVTIPIGRPISNTTAYVLGPDQHPVAIEASGELYLGGDGVALGYINRLGQTAERFLKDPFSGDSSARMYRTGDMVKLCRDGTIEFLGRLDDQVKIRGHRIELAEIEMVLRQCQAVKDAVASLLNTANGDKLLVAYITSGNATHANADDLKTHIRELLPSYMVPAHIVLLDEFPLTANGKVDKAALPDPRSLRRSNEPPPPDALEMQLAQIWSELLGVQRIGTSESFFALGGDSLSAIQLVSRMRDVFTVETSIRDIFQRPTLSELAEHLRQELGQQLPPGIPRPISRPNSETAPLSFAQQRLWFLERFHPGLTAYNCAFAFHIKGALDADVLGQCVNQIVRRHDVLRTTYREHAGEPVQVVAPSSHLSIDAFELTGPRLAERLAEALQRIAEEARKPLDLETGPLFRAELMRIAEEHAILAVVCHHIMIDGWSVAVFQEELARLYEAYAMGRPCPLPELKLQYADYAAWQHRCREQNLWAPQLDYWRNQLAGPIPRLDLPLDHPRPPRLSFRGATVSADFDPALTEKLRDLCRNAGVTVTSLVMALWQTLFLRYAGQEEIVIGVATSGRNRTEIEGLIGFFVNTLVLRVDLSGNPPFREALLRVHEAALAAYAHQDLPFEQLVAHLQQSRESDRQPLIQVLFAGQHSGPEEVHGGGLSISAHEVYNQSSKFDLTISMFEHPQRIAHILEYDSSIFDQPTAARMMGHFLLLAKGVAEDCERSLLELPLLTEAERDYVLFSLNDTRRAVPIGLLVHDCFSLQAARMPDLVAVSCGRESVTYAELQARATRLATIVSEHTQPDDAIVAVFLDPSVNMAAAVLGILMAGKAYLPLAADYPPERLAYMLEDAQVTVILTDRAMKRLLPSPADGVICLEEIEAGSIDSSPEPFRAPSRSDESLAYVIYTSGSTGRPKGVALPHRALANLILWQAEHSTAAARTRTLQFAPLSFDVSFQEMFCTWATGGTLVLVSDKTRRDMETLLDTIIAEDIERLFLPFVALQGLAQTAVDRCVFPTCLIEVITAGEQLCITAPIRTFFSRMPACKLINQYGPTESHVVSTYELRGAPEEWPALPPIGRPIDNVFLYILDRMLQPVPIGVPGELHIGGIGLADGYLNRPELTAERFFPNPYDPIPQSRMYRTGDLARVLSTGEMEFLGRNDQQTKIRGYRVETGEIETVLSNHNDIREAVVVAKGASERMPSSDGSHLVAYLVPQSSGACSALGPGELRSYLQSLLPSYMIPSSFVWVDAIPLTPSGKVDRRALPEPERSDVLEGEYVAPATPTETALARIWIELLRLDRVGAADDFFVIGGHSLLAVRMVNRVLEALDVKLPLRDVFRFPSLGLLGRHIDSLPKVSRDESSILLRPVDRSQPIPLSFSQEGLYFLEKLSPSLPEYNVPVVYRLRGPLQTGALMRSVDQVVARHEALRTRFATRDAKPIQVIDDRLAGLLRLVDLTDQPEQDRFDECMRLVAAQARRCFSFDQGPLLDAALYRLAGDDHVLCIVLHHIVTDGWSIGVFCRELGEFYNAIVENRSPALNPLSIHFADFSHWQRQVQASGGFAPSLRYWLESLQQPLPELAFLESLAPSTQAVSAGGFESSWIPAGIASAAASYCRESGTTLFVLLLALWDSLLHRYTGADDILVGTPIAGRGNAQLDDLVGYFVNTLLIRAAIPRGCSLCTLLAQTHQRMLEAQRHQDLPFEILVNALAPARVPGQVPIVQSVFVLQNAASSHIKLEAIESEPLNIHNGTAKFPLTLIATHEPDGSIRLDLEYASALFERNAAHQILLHYGRLLADGLAHPDTPLADLAMLTPEEESLLLGEWNTTRRDYPRDASIPQLFETQAARAPKATAVVYGAEALTYGELNARANQMARHLRERGARPDGIVAVCMERAPHLVMTILGILKAGCAYLPLDPDCPKKRIIQVLDDAKPALLVTAGSPAAVLADAQVPTLVLETELETIGAYSVENLEPSPVTGESLANVIYTSGSTGGPKGVCVPHRAVLRLVLNTNYISIEPGDRVAQASNMAFDAATFELWGALLNGACLVGIPRATMLSPRELKAFLQRQRIDVLWVTAGLFNRIAGQEPDAFQTVHTVLTGGEALSPKWVRRVLEASPPGRLLNGYGPTESTTFATWHAIREVPDHAVSIPIGQPIANTTAYVLGNHLKLLPVGIPGELYLGGDGLAIGYLRDPELTQQRFVPHPFVPGERLYRTGDLVKRNPDGAIDFIGRLDGQVKIRGFRVELEEVESAIQACPGVGDAAVVARTCANGSKELVAYIVPQDGESPKTDAMRRELGAHLPEYMVPSRFVQLVELPINANGKVDKRHLPEPYHDASEFSGAYEEPASETEKALAAIWSELLGRPTVSRSDGFFDLGGNSLLAIQLQSQIEKRFDSRFTVRDVFEFPRLDRQAEKIERASAQGDSADHEAADTRFMIPVQAEGSKTPLFFVTGAGDVIGIYGTLVSLLNPERPFYGFPDPMFTPLSTEVITVERLAELYLREIRAVQPHGPYYLGGYSLGGLVAYEMARLLLDEGEDVAKLIVLDTCPPAKLVGRPVHTAKAVLGRVRFFGRKLISLFRSRSSLAHDLRAILVLAAKQGRHASLRKRDEPAIREYVRWAFRNALRTQEAPEPEPDSTAGRESRLHMLEDPHILSLYRSGRMARRVYNAYSFPEYRGRLTLLYAKDGGLGQLPGTEAFGWSPIVKGGVEMHAIPGTHISIFKQPDVVALACAMERCLDPKNGS